MAEGALNFPAILDAAEQDDVSLTSYSVDEDGIWKIENRWTSDSRSYSRMPTLVSTARARDGMAVYVQVALATDLPSMALPWTKEQARKRKYRKHAVQSSFIAEDGRLILSAIRKLTLSHEVVKALRGERPDPEVSEGFAQHYLFMLTELRLAFADLEKVRDSYRKMH